MTQWVGTTPWGKAQHIEKKGTGICFVSTAGHGGIRITKRVAHARLSRSALSRAIEGREHYFWEEDCRWAIPCFELKELQTESRTERVIMLTLSRWDADYLIENRIEPLKEQFDQWKADADEDKRRRERDPDLIVAARGIENSHLCQVWTADGKEHTVTEESYKKRTKPNLLSNCTKG